MKWRNRIFWLRILIMVLVIVGSYLAYAFIYRGRNEPPTKRKTTNQEAAYYTLRGQIQMLSQKEALMAFAFEDRKKERELSFRRSKATERKQQKKERIARIIVPYLR